MVKSFYNYLEFEKRYSAHTLEAYQSDIEQFQDFLNHTYSISDLNETRATHLRSWLVSLHTAHISNRSINRKISALKSLFTFLRKRYGLSTNPLRKVINPKVEKRLPLTVRKEHLEQLFTSNDLNIEEENSWKEQRNNLIMEILYNCGLRRSELMNLKMMNIDYSRQLIKVQGKGKKERSIPVSPDLLKKIKEYLIVREEVIVDLEAMNHTFIFFTDKGEPIYAKWVYNLVKRSLTGFTSIERKSPHILRHSFATHLSDAGADLNAIKTLLGHSSLAATQVYMHNSIEKLKKVYDQAHPKS